MVKSLTRSNHDRRVSGASHPLRLEQIPEWGGRMIRQENRRQWVPRTAELTLAAGLAATYIITTFVPLTPFIGGPPVYPPEIVILSTIRPRLRPAPPPPTLFCWRPRFGLGQPPFYPVFSRPRLLHR